LELLRQIDVGQGEDFRKLTEKINELQSDVLSGNCHEFTTQNSLALLFFICKNYPFELQKVFQNVSYFHPTKVNDNDNSEFANSLVRIHQ
jgi:hypothetical protein